MRFNRIAIVICFLSLAASSSAADWPQFRGPNGSGRAATNDPLPTEIGPKAESLAWRTELPPGHSSPVVIGERIFVTGERDGKLLTISLDRKTGKVLWEKAAPYEKLEVIHAIGSHAQCTPAADESCVIAFFGSAGLMCYDHDGNLIWDKPMGPFSNTFGAGSSPLIDGETVILGQDHDQESFLMALDKRTGDVLWKTDRSEFPRNWCTPVIWENDGRKQIVMAATLRVVGYDFETGAEEWTVRGISRTVCMTPVVGDDGNLYLAGWAAGGDENEPIPIEPFADAASQFDKNQNGTLEEAELPDNPIQQRFPQVDRNKDGSVTMAEYEYFKHLFESGQNMVLSIKPGAKGEATDTHVRWTQRKQVPFCASPLYHDGMVFTVKDGGIVSCWNAENGKPLKQMRLPAPATDEYYASPTYADGKIFFANQPGVVSVVSADKKLEVLHQAEFGEDIYASPAIANGKIYLRTAAALYCFGR